MFNPLTIIADLTQIYGIEYAGIGIVAFGVSAAIYSVMHFGKVNF